MKHEMKPVTQTQSTSHLRAVLLALLVTFLWSTSWVLIKLGLQASLPPLTFAGLRYTLAFLCLLPFVLMKPSHLQSIKDFSKSTWFLLVLLGLVFYTITQGAQFIGSTMLPQIAILVWVFLGESLNQRQILGLGLVTIGIIIVQVWRGKKG